MKVIKFLLLLVIIAFAIYFFRSQKAATPTPQSTKNTSLEKAVSQNLDGTHGSYAVVVKNLKTGVNFSLNEQRQFETASLYKLWVMATAIKQIEQGLLDKDETLSQDVAYLNTKFGIPQDQAELTDGTVSIDVKSAIEQMITTSNNYDTFLLTDRLGTASIAAFLKDNNFADSNIGTDNVSPTTTAFDMALFLEKLYRGQLANKENTDWMLSILKNQQLNEKIPKNLPAGTIIAHKTGELDPFSHDAGIVFAPKGDYIIVVLSESDRPDLASDRIADISKAVYDFFE